MFAAFKTEKPPEFPLTASLRPADRDRPQSIVLYWRLCFTGGNTDAALLRITQGMEAAETCGPVNLFPT